MLQLRALELSDFSGGMTDDYIAVDPRKAKLMENFFLTPQGKPVMRSGSELDISAAEARAEIPSNHRIDLLFAAITDENTSLLHKISRGKFYYDDASTTLAELQGPATASLFPSTSTISSGSPWNQHIFFAGYSSSTTIYRPQKVYAKGTGESTPPLRLRTAGLPKPVGTSAAQTADPDSPAVNTPGFVFQRAVGANQYLTAFCWKYTYTVGDRTFIDRGPLLKFTLTSAATPAKVRINSTVALTNGTGEQWDVSSSSLVIEYYRTIAGGTVYYKVGELANTSIAASITDGVSDANLVLNATLYTTGGIAENDPPPKARYVHVSQLGYGYYAYCIDPNTSEPAPNRVYQSKSSDPDSVPWTFYAEVDDPITGLSSHQGIPLVFTDSNVYRIDGALDQFGFGQLTPRKIADYVGCISHLSIVQTPDGVFFAGTNGFYWTDGYKVLKISENLNKTYRDSIVIAMSDTEKKRICGAYDEQERRIWWGYQSDQDNSDNDACFILHLYFGIRPDACFTTLTGTGFQATALLYDQGYMYRATATGYTMRHKESLTTDPKVDTATAVSAWFTRAILYDFQSIYMDFGDAKNRKWVPRFLVTLEADSDISVQPSVDRELVAAYRACKEIKEASNVLWGVSAEAWGDPALYSATTSIVQRLVRCPAQSLRASYWQFRLQNANTIISKSDSLGLGTVNTSTKRVTLVDAADYDWPTDVIDYTIAFSDDDYETEFTITTRNSADQITYSDSGNVGPASNGNYGWVLRGYKKGDRCNLLSVVVHHASLTPSQMPYQAGEEGGNA